MSESLNCHAQHHNHSGMQCAIRSEWSAAIAHFERAIVADPSNADYHANLGLALLMRAASSADAQNAIAAFRVALHHNSFLPVVWGYLGAAYAALEGDDDTALDFLLRGLAEPSVFVLRHLCLVYARRGQYYEAEFYAEAILALHPDDEPAHFTRALMLLTTGEFAAGWQEFEWRKRIPLHTKAQLWQGEDISDKHLLLHAEAGIGDSLQFCRFIPDLAQRCAKLSVYERPELRAVLRTAFASERILICDQVPEDIDYYSFMMGSGQRLHLHAGNVDRGSYLQAPGDAAWGHRLASLPRPRVGLVWSGDANNAVDARRSLSLCALHDLLAVPVGWVSLQMQRAEPCAMFDAAPWINDWSDTANAIAALDLVISVDTAVAHLAGAMGKPVWLLNRYDTCWRWGMTGERSAWYPSMRIFRQPTLGDWTSVVRAVATRLRDNPDLA